VTQSNPTQSNWEAGFKKLLLRWLGSDLRRRERSDLYFSNTSSIHATFNYFLVNSVSTILSLSNNGCNYCDWNYQKKIYCDWNICQKSYYVGFFNYSFTLQRNTFVIIKPLLINSPTFSLFVDLSYFLRTFLFNSFFSQSRVSHGE
jgi:hypothetical protein